MRRRRAHSLEKTTAPRDRERSQARCTESASTAWHCAHWNTAHLSGCSHRGSRGRNGSSSNPSPAGPTDEDPFTSPEFLGPGGPEPLHLGDRGARAPQLHWQGDPEVGKRVAQRHPGSQGVTRTFTQQIYINQALIVYWASGVQPQSKPRRSQ